MKKNEQNSNHSLLAVFQALGDPIRLDIVACLLKLKERRIISSTYDISKSTLSHHIKVLKEADILQVRKEGVTHIYSINEDFLNITYPGILALIEQHVHPHD